MGKRKRGALSREDMEFISKNVDRFSVEEIASSINRNVAPVKRYIRENRLGKQWNDNIGDGEKTETIILKELKAKSFYNNLKTQLSIPELQYFCDHWVGMVTQFQGDLLPSEEMELKELLILEILKNREAAAEKTRLEQKDVLEKELSRERKLDKELQDKDYIRSLQAEITNILATSTSYIKNFKDLCDRADKMRKALHASRQDRTKDLKNSKIDFSSWLKMLEDYNNSKRVAHEMAVLKAAKEKESERLGKYHTYSNKEVARPILNEDTVSDE